VIELKNLLCLIMELNKRFLSAIGNESKKT
jgi:hypothetical protein